MTECKFCCECLYHSYCERKSEVATCCCVDDCFMTVVLAVSSLKAVRALMTSMRNRKKKMNFVFL